MQPGDVSDSRLAARVKVLRPRPPECACAGVSRVSPADACLHMVNSCEWEARGLLVAGRHRQGEAIERQRLYVPDGDLVVPVPVPVPVS